MDPTTFVPQTLPTESSPVEDDENQAGYGEERVKKRQRVAAACDECRAKKIKCDGHLPRCTPCRRKMRPSATCTWSVRNGRRNGTSKDQLELLQRRIEELERERKHPVLQDHHDATTPLPTPPHSLSPVVSISLKDTNAMMGFMEEEHPSSPNDFGNSSVTSFMNQIRSLINRQSIDSDRQKQAYPHSAPKQLGFVNRAENTSSQMFDYVLPSRQRADQLLESYWSLVDTLYPFLDRDEICSRYDTIWTTEPVDDGRTFLCLLNMIFSITCVSDPSIRSEQRASSAHVFYERARSFFNLDLFQSRSILTVQCFLLLGQYLQSTSNPQQCWILVGFAIRVAQSLGLDLPSTSAQAQTEKRRNLLRKVWHGCVLMDRAVSMTFGRPAMITAQAAALVPRPMAHEDQSNCSCYTKVCRLDSGSRESHFLIESLKLYEYMSETLLTVYGPTSQEQPDDDPYAIYFGSLGIKAAKDILDIDDKLLTWSRCLPIHLQHRPDIDKTTLHHRQSNVLWLRYCHVRVLLFRPVLSRLCSQAGDHDRRLDGSMCWTLAFQYSRLCVKASLETIRIVSSIIEGRDQEEFEGLLPAWWYCIFYVYTAGTVLLAARLHPLIMADITEPTILNSCNTAISILRRFEPFGQPAKLCVAVLSALFDQIPRRQQEQLLQETLHQHPQLQQSLPPPQQQQTPQSGSSYQRKSKIQSLEECEVIEVITDVTVPPQNLHARTDPIDNISLPETQASQSWVPPPPPPPQRQMIVDLEGPSLDFSSTTGLYDVSNLQFDLSDMSWLNSNPFQQFSD